MAASGEFGIEAADLRDRSPGTGPVGGGPALTPTEMMQQLFRDIPGSLPLAASPRPPPTSPTVGIPAAHEYRLPAPMPRIVAIPSAMGHVPSGSDPRRFLSYLAGRLGTQQMAQLRQEFEETDFQ